MNDAPQISDSTPISLTSTKSDLRKERLQQALKHNMMRRKEQPKPGLHRGSPDKLL